MEEISIMERFCLKNEKAYEKFRTHITSMDKFYIFLTTDKNLGFVSIDGLDFTLDLENAFIGTPRVS